MAKQNQNVQSANQNKVLIDGKQIGLLQSIRMDDSYGLEGAYGIGDIDPVEHVPTQASYSVSISNMALKKASLRSLGLVPENGQAALNGIVFDVESYDEQGNLKRKYEGCSYDSGAVDVSANRIIMVSGQFKALRVSGTGV